MDVYVIIGHVHYEMDDALGVADSTEKALELLKVFAEEHGEVIKLIDADENEVISVSLSFKRTTDQRKWSDYDSYSIIPFTMNATLIKKW